MPTQAHDSERPATFSELFRVAEYRALYTAISISWFGDYLARAAVTALIYQRTNSVAYSAAAFATSYLPWVVGGPLLAAMAERYRYRHVMILCDLLRMALIILVAVPGMPIPFMILLLFLVALINPPAQAAKSALMPLILSGDRLVLGLSLNQSTGQAAQVIGYVAGAALAPFYPSLALLIDAATFAVSAVLLSIGVRDRPSAMTQAHRSHLMRETGEGFRLVFGTRVLRAIALVVFTSMLFVVVPEGLAAAWAGDLMQGSEDRGLTQGVIMAANPLGLVLGGLLISRLVRPERRRKLIRIAAIIAPMTLVPALFDPGVSGVVAMSAVCGFVVGGLLPPANGLFVQALPNGFRARAFGVMQSGVQVTQGVAVLATGLLSDVLPLYLVVGLWSLAGVLLTVGITYRRWPSSREFGAAIEAAAAHNAAAAQKAAAAQDAGAAHNAAAAQTAAAAQNEGAAQNAVRGAIRPVAPGGQDAPPRPPAAGPGSLDVPRHSGAPGM